MASAAPRCGNQKIDWSDYSRNTGELHDYSQKEGAVFIWSQDCAVSNEMYQCYGNPKCGPRYDEPNRVILLNTVRRAKLVRYSPPEIIIDFFVNLVKNIVDPSQLHPELEVYSDMLPDTQKDMIEKLAELKTITEENGMDVDWSKWEKDGKLDLE